MKISITDISHSKQSFLLIHTKMANIDIVRDPNNELYQELERKVTDNSNFIQFINSLQPNKLNDTSFAKMITSLSSEVLVSSSFLEGLQSLHQQDDDIITNGKFTDAIRVMAKEFLTSRDFLRFIAKLDPSLLESRADNFSFSGQIRPEYIAALRGSLSKEVLQDSSFTGFINNIDLSNFLDGSFAEFVTELDSQVLRDESFTGELSRLESSVLTNGKFTNEVSSLDSLLLTSDAFDDILASGDNLDARDSRYKSIVPGKLEDFNQDVAFQVFKEYSDFYKSGGKDSSSPTAEAKQLAILAASNLDRQNIRDILDVRARNVGRDNAIQLPSRNSAQTISQSNRRYIGTAQGDTIINAGTDNQFFTSGGNDIVTLGNGTYNFADLGLGADEAFLNAGTLPARGAVSSGGVINTSSSTPSRSPSPNDTPQEIIAQASTRPDGLLVAIDEVDLGIDNDRDIATFVKDDPLTGYGLREVGIVRNFDRNRDIIRLQGDASEYLIRDIDGIGTEIVYVQKITAGSSLPIFGGSVDGGSDNGIPVRRSTIGIIDGVFLQNLNSNSPTIEYF